VTYTDAGVSLNSPIIKYILYEIVFVNEFTFVYNTNKNAFSMKGDISHDNYACQ